MKEFPTGSRQESPAESPETPHRLFGRLVTEDLSREQQDKIIQRIIEGGDPGAAFWTLAKIEVEPDQAGGLKKAIIESRNGFWANATLDLERIKVISLADEEREQLQRIFDEMMSKPIEKKPLKKRDL